MQEIVPGLFLGDYADSQNYPALQSNGITHVVAARKSKPQILLDRTKIADSLDCSAANLPHSRQYHITQS